MKKLKENRLQLEKQVITSLLENQLSNVKGGGKSVDVFLCPSVMCHTEFPDKPCLETDGGNIGMVEATGWEGCVIVRTRPTQCSGIYT